MSTFIRTNTPDLHNLNISAQAYAVMEYAQHPPVFTSIFQVVPLDNRKEYVTSNLSGFNELTFTPEDGDYPETSMVEGYDKTFAPLKHTASLPVSEEQWDDDPKGVINRIETFGRGFGRAALHKQEKLCAAVLNGAFTSTLTPDGQFLCDTDHPKSPLETGTIYSNKITTTTLDANGAALEEMFEKFYNNFFDMAGHQIIVPRWILCVPPALAVPAMQSTVSMYGTKSSANVAGTNAPTPVSSGELMGDIKVVVNPYMSAANGGSDTAYFLIADPTSVPIGEHSLLYVERKPLTIEPLERIQKTNSYLMKGSMRGVAGARDWRYVLGATGA